MSPPDLPFFCNFLFSSALSSSFLFLVSPSVSSALSVTSNACSFHLQQPSSLPHFGPHLSSPTHHREQLTPPPAFQNRFTAPCLHHFLSPLSKFSLNFLAKILNLSLMCLRQAKVSTKVSSNKCDIQDKGPRKVFSNVSICNQRFCKGVVKWE